VKQSHHSPITVPLQSHHSPITAPSQPHHSPITVASQSNHSPITVPSQSNHNPITFQLQSHYSPITVQSQSNHSPIAVPSQSNHSPITVLSQSHHKLRKSLSPRLAAPLNRTTQHRHFKSFFVGVALQQRTNLLSGRLWVSKWPMKCQLKLVLRARTKHKSHANKFKKIQQENDFFLFLRSISRIVFGGGGGVFGLFPNIYRAPLFFSRVIKNSFNTLGKDL